MPKRIMKLLNNRPKPIMKLLNNRPKPLHTPGDFLIEFQDHAPGGVVGKIEDALYSVVGLEGVVPIDKENVVTVHPSIGIAIVGAAYPRGSRAGIPFKAVQQFNENLEDKLDAPFTLRVL